METNTISITDGTTTTSCTNTVTLDRTLVNTEKNSWYQYGKLADYGNLPYYGNLDNIWGPIDDTLSISEEHLSYKKERTTIKSKPAWALPSKGSSDEVADEPHEYFRLIQLATWLN